MHCNLKDDSYYTIKLELGPQDDSIDSFNKCALTPRLPC